MGSKSNLLENALLDHVLGGGDYPRPASVYIALFSDECTDAGPGTEFSGGAYARVGIDNAASEWGAASDNSNQKVNANDISFATATAGWGGACSFGIFDDLSAGSMLYWSNLSASKQIDSGDTAKFPAGCIMITED